MLFYTKLNSENRSRFIITNFLPFMPCRFSNDLFALNICRILNIENKIKEVFFGFQAFNQHSADKLQCNCCIHV